MEGKSPQEPQPVPTYRAIVDRLNDLGILDDPAFARELLEEFMKDAADVIAKLAAAIAQGDADACERLGHRIKGASLNIGAERLAGLAMLVEQAGHDKDLTGLDEVHEVLNHEFGDVRAFLIRILESPAPR
jgi:HPt (histidine-containing phosphotransfer) domain-containing protein